MPGILDNTAFTSGGGGPTLNAPNLTQYTQPNTQVFQAPDLNAPPTTPSTTFGAPSTTSSTMGSAASTTTPTTTPAATTTSTTGTSALTDMSGKTWGALGTTIPQGWFMDGQGNFVFKGTGSPTGTQPSGVTTLPASYVSTAFNPAETAANLTAGGYTQQPDGSWTNTTKSAQDWQTIYGGGQAGAPGTQSVAPPAGVASPTSSPNTLSNNDYLTQLILNSLTGGQNAQNQSQVVQTPLGYTQYQSSVPQGNSNSAIQQMLLQYLQGSAGSGGSQDSFWNLLGGSGSGGSSGSTSSNILPLILSLLGGG